MSSPPSRFRYVPSDNRPLNCNSSESEIQEGIVAIAHQRQHRQDQERHGHHHGHGVGHQPRHTACKAAPLGGRHKPFGKERNDGRAGQDSHQEEEQVVEQGVVGVVAVKALAKAKEAKTPSGVAVVSGSLYLTGDVLQREVPLSEVINL